MSEYWCPHDQPMGACWVCDELNALRAELAREKAAREAAEGQSARWFKSFTDETLARSADIVRLTAQRDAAEKARDEFVWMTANGARCSFCGENMLAEESAQHMETCPKHPLEAEREITRGLRAQVEQLKQERNPHPREGKMSETSRDFRYLCDGENIPPDRGPEACPWCEDSKRACDQWKKGGGLKCCPGCDHETNASKGGDENE